MSKETGRYESVTMPRRYLAEMVADRVAACKVYEGENYTPGSALAYLNKSREKNILDADLRKQLTYLLTMLAEKGEKETYGYIRNSVLKGKPFPWETSCDLT